jgi:hypothetical protein
METPVFVDKSSGERVEGKRLVVWIPAPLHASLKARAYLRGWTLGHLVDTILQDDDLANGGELNVP